MCKNTTSYLKNNSDFVKITLPYMQLALLNLYDSLLNNTDEGKYSCCIFFGFVKSFRIGKS